MVSILPNEQYEFLMTTKEVACGYGVTAYNIRQHSMKQSSELIEGKHYVRGVSMSHTLANAQPHQVFWTKRGIVRLGFFIKSERAKLFRDWAEELIIKVDEQRGLFGEIASDQPKRLPHPRRHNRLSSERIINILTLVNEIEDKDLRMKLSNEITGGYNYGN